MPKGGEVFVCLFLLYKGKCQAVSQAFYKLLIFDGRLFLWMGCFLKLKEETNDVFLFMLEMLCLVLPHSECERDLLYSD